MWPLIAGTLLLIGLEVALLESVRRRVAPLEFTLTVICWWPVNLMRHAMWAARQPYHHG